MLTLRYLETSPATTTKIQISGISATDKLATSWQSGPSVMRRTSKLSTIPKPYRGAASTEAIGAILLLWIGSMTTGCAHGAARRDASLRLVAEPNNAALYVDERYVGTARTLERYPALLASGKHQLTVQAPGYFPHDVEVQLTEGLTTVRMKLRPVPP